MFKHIKIVLFLLPFTFFGQKDPADSLKSVLKTSKHDTITCSALNRLIEISEDGIWEKFNEDLRLIVDKNLKESALNETLKKRFKFYKSVYLNNDGYYYQRKNDFKNAEKNYLLSLATSQSIGDKKSASNTMGNLGALYHQVDHLDDAIKYQDQSLKIRTEINDEAGIANSLSNLAVIYRQKGDINNALQNFYKSLKIAEKLNDYYGIVNNKYNIATVYQLQNMTDKAFELFTECKKMAEQKNDISNLSQTLNALGTILLIKGDTAQSLKDIYRALELKKTIGDKYNYAAILENLGVIVQQKDPDKAIKYYEESLQIKKEIQDIPGQAGCLYNLAYAYLRKKNINQALLLGNESLALSKKTGYPEFIRNSARVLKDIYTAKKDYKNSLEMLELYISMRDSVINTQTEKASLRSQLNYEYEKKTYADSIKTVQEKKITALKFKQEENQRYFLYAGLFLTLIFGAFMFNRFKITQKQKDVIHLQKIMVENQKHVVEEKQKEVVDSIRYAKRIQQSLLPTDRYIERILKNKI